MCIVYQCSPFVRTCFVLCTLILYISGTIITSILFVQYLSFQLLKCYAIIFSQVDNFMIDTISGIQIKLSNEFLKKIIISIGTFECCIVDQQTMIDELLWHKKKLWLYLTVRLIIHSTFIEMSNYHKYSWRMNIFVKSSFILGCWIRLIFPENFKTIFQWVNKSKFLFVTHSTCTIAILQLLYWFS